MCVDIITFYQMKNHFEMKGKLKKMNSSFINIYQLSPEWLISQD